MTPWIRLASGPVLPAGFPVADPFNDFFAILGGSENSDKLPIPECLARQGHDFNHLVGISRRRQDEEDAFDRTLGGYIRDSLPRYSEGDVGAL